MYTLCISVGWITIFSYMDRGVMKKKEPKTIAQYTDEQKLKEVLDNDIRRIDAKQTIARKREQNPATLKYYHINGIRLDILDEAIKVYESNLGGKKRANNKKGH